MKRRLRVVALVVLLGGLAWSGAAGWMYYRARTQAKEGMSLLERSLELYDQSDTVKGTPAENRLIEEGHSYERSGEETMASARTSHRWAIISGIGGSLLVLVSIAIMLAYLKTKESASSS